MPVRRINFTGRKRILQQSIDLRLESDPAGQASFSASFDLASYQFPPDARVVVEAYRQTTSMRFDFGTVSVPTPPGDTTLAQFATADEVLFRFRVTDVSERPGALLGEADRLRPSTPEQAPDDRMPLLPAHAEDLGQEVWQLEFGEEVRLKVNSGLPDWKGTVRSEAFHALVFPAAMRQVLERILLIEQYTETEDMDNWRSRWLRFGELLPGSSRLPEDRSEHEQWVDDAVGAFARASNLLDLFQSATAV
jgi:hypothetical protein